MITYWYHPESDSFFLCENDKEKEDAASQGCDEIEYEQYMQAIQERAR